MVAHPPSPYDFTIPSGRVPWPSGTASCGAMGERHISLFFGIPRISVPHSRYVSGQQFLMP